MSKYAYANRIGEPTVCVIAYDRGRDGPARDALSEMMGARESRLRPYLTLSYQSPARAAAT
jgi:hypothetical protein